MKRRKGIGPRAPDLRGQELGGGRHGRGVPALRRVDEHLHQVIVHAVVEVALEGPGELRVLDVARREWARSRCAGPGERSLSCDDQFDAAVVLAGGEIEQGVIVAASLGQHFFERRHGLMLA